MHYSGYINSPVGPLEIVTSTTHLLAIRFLPHHPIKAFLPENAPTILKEAIEQLQAYFSGKRFHFSLPLQLSGTPFQKDVWHALQTIPYGTTISYQELAYRAGYPRAARAVGNANGKNPIPIVLPCHRVIRSDGSIGGYSSGISIKHQLLQLEQQYIRNQ